MFNEARLREERRYSLFWVPISCAHSAQILRPECLNPAVQVPFS